MKAKTDYRYRLTFSKKKRVKYVGHLDTVLTWTRAFRRAQVPLAYSKGYNPQARIQVAASLPVGYIGRQEVMDVYLKSPMESADILQRVGDTLPEGFGISGVEAVDPKAPTLQARLCQADYRVTAEIDLQAADINQRIARLLAAEQVLQQRIRRRKEETFDLRPLLHQLTLESLSNGDAVFVMRLSAGASGNLRPEAVLQALNLGDIWHEVERTRLIFDNH